MKMQVVGFEGVSGVGKKSGKHYEIGSVHVVVPLAPSFSEDGIARGLMGTTYQCQLDLINKIKNLQPPFMADMVITPIMRFGKREEELTDIIPVKSS